MTISAGLLLAIFLVLFGVLLIVALVHIIQGIRFGGGTKLSLLSNGLFVLLVVVVTMAVAVFLRPVDWGNTFTISVPFFPASSDTTQQ